MRQNNERLVLRLTDKVPWITEQTTQKQEKFTSTLDEATQKSYCQQQQLSTKSLTQGDIKMINLFTVIFTKFFCLSFTRKKIVFRYNKYLFDELIKTLNIQILFESIIFVLNFSKYILIQF
jgi:hypothetical protein